MDLLKEHLNDPKVKEIESINMDLLILITADQDRNYAGIKSIKVYIYDENINFNQSIFTLTYSQILKILNIQQEQASVFFNPTFFYLFRNNGHQINEEYINKISCDSINLSDAITHFFYNTVETIEKTIYQINDVKDLYV